MKSLAPESETAQSLPRKRRTVILALVGVAIAGAMFWGWRTYAPGGSSASGGSASAFGGPGGEGRFDPNRISPVSAVAASTGRFDVRLNAIGTVTARSTVTVRPRVDGQLEKVLFTEGQMVRAGQVLAVIDPKPFEVQVASAEGQLARDTAQLQNAQSDLERYRALLAQDSISKQQVDNQEALVRQYQGVVATDRASVDNAKLQLSYTRVSAPVSGRAGLRQIDAGNMVSAASTTGLVVITEVRPIHVIFTLPQDQLPAVLKRLQAGARLSAQAWDREGRVQLAQGRLLTVDNQIDTTTGTVKLKAEFANLDSSLFPNQFVNIRLLVDTLDSVVTVPSTAVQRGAPGQYVYVVKDDNTVSLRIVKPGGADGDKLAINDGVVAGERVVVDGIDRLREGAKVEIIDGATPGKGQRKRGEGKAGT
jgi:multidrug efflux system membrane fusion protein